MKKRFLNFLMPIFSLFGIASASEPSYSELVTDVTPEEFEKAIRSDSTAFILDVRTPGEFEEEHINGAHYLDWVDQKGFGKDFEAIPKDATIYIYCRSGRRSASAAQYLAKRGYKVVNMLGGFLEWQRQLGR